MKNLTTKPAPLDHIQYETPWPDFWVNLWHHDIFMILFISSAIGFAAWASQRASRDSDIPLFVIGAIGACTGILWLATT